MVAITESDSPVPIISNGFIRAVVKSPIIMTRERIALVMQLVDRQVFTLLATLYVDVVVTVIHYLSRRIKKRSKHKQKDYVPKPKSGIVQIILLFRSTASRNTLTLKLLLLFNLGSMEFTLFSNNLPQMLQ